MKLTYHPNQSSKLSLHHQQKPLQKPQKPPKPPKNSFECNGTLFQVDERYQYTKYIGHGAYGVVCSAKDKKKNTKVAIKKVINAFQDLVDGRRILRQIRLLKFLRHPNIIALTDIQLPQKRDYQDVYIITQLMETDLHKVIYSKSQKLGEQHMRHFLHQLLKGLNYMHSANIMHRDLKPSNLLCNRDCTVKICDMGLARGFEEDDEQADKTEYVVTRWYRAPEVILKASEYTKAIDVWSAGCIFAELLGSTALFPGKDYLDQVQRIISVLGTPTVEDQRFIVSQSALKYIKGLPRRTKMNWKTLFPQASALGLDLLDKMLTFNPQKRITTEDCLKHPYFSEDCDELQEQDYAPKIFDWSSDTFDLTKQNLQDYIYKQALLAKK